ncbi:hypothetical protein HanRHA438_Chr17g0826091 [Helianthus annuus]|nr:hypothetical protein HanRHA438_Chr17g0826091 [Helianthus annuus]
MSLSGYPFVSSFLVCPTSGVSLSLQELYGRSSIYILPLTFFTQACLLRRFFIPSLPVCFSIFHISPKASTDGSVGDGLNVVLNDNHFRHSRIYAKGQ